MSWHDWSENIVVHNTRLHVRIKLVVFDWSVSGAVTTRSQTLGSLVVNFV